MTRSLCSLALVALIVAGLATAQDNKAQQDRKPAASKDAEQGPLRFDQSRMFAEHDINKDGFLDRSEVPARLLDRFAQLDTNKDGKLSRDELEKGVALTQPSRRPADVLMVLIDMSDCDECCVEELQHFYATLRKLDANNDGKISPEEMASARKVLVAKRVDDLVKDLDRDKNGTISRDEARGHVRTDFDKIDADKNGQLSRDELTRAASERPAAVKPAENSKRQ